MTLTFPDLFPDQATAKRRLDTLFKRWKRRWRSTAAIWRMEVIDRKSGKNKGQVAPHFHLLVWGEFDGELASKDWFEVCGKSDYAQLRHGTKADQMQSWAGAVSYTAKYLAKTADFESEGRCWGIHNKAAMPIDTEPRAIRINLSQAFRFQRLVRAWIKSRTGRRRSSARSVFTANPCKWWAAVIEQSETSPQ